MNMTRRQLLVLSAMAGTSAMTPFMAASAAEKGKQAMPQKFKISLAQWSLHKGFFDGTYNLLDFAKIAREKFDIDAIEYVNQFYAKTLTDKLIRELRQRADDHGVFSNLIMCDHEGALGDPDAKARKQAVKNHYRWADAAHQLGCQSIRVNAQSSGSWDEQMKLAADGLHQLAEYAGKLNLNVIVENHGGLSSNGKWLSGVMKTANHPRVGTLPDFGNFVINRDTGESYDRYKGVAELMPFAKGVSAKTFTFDKDGNETDIDYLRIMKLVVDAGYSDWVGIEYEGDDLAEEVGIMKTKQLLERTRSALSKA
ncbi:sugar phosphate isomerase/epimerase family protein [Teredinibacter waterburyi]|jgi:Sugar phosphate isomerases/epimerases|uniref:sugar phosphate isomerase/epimerase family protein n=1 Tax=Teredinibacter waterburyi TaxID=1500538 RepID=UPI001660004B|nr:sugar phosphate isomerase/epimerase family protein [Teredinibacter waterburyi]